MGTIMVTGATGRLGRALVSRLVFKNESVKAVVRRASGVVFPGKIERIEHDLSSAPLPASAFSGIEKVVHLAGLVGDYPYSQLYAANVKATKNLLANCPKSVKRVVIASSISIYGEYAGREVDETFSPKTESPYGKSKLEAEKAARKFDLPITFLRFGMIFGPGFEEGYFEVFDLLLKEKMRIIGNGKNRMPLLHADDAVEAILLALGKNTPQFREYNIVGGERFTQGELLSLAADELGVLAPQERIGRGGALLTTGALSLMSIFPITKKPKFTSENIRQLSLDRAYSTGRAKKELGFEAKVKLASGIKEMAGIYLKKRGVHGKG